MNIIDFIKSDPTQNEKSPRNRQSRDQKKITSSQRQNQNKMLPSINQSTLNLSNYSSMLKDQNMISNFFPVRTGFDEKPIPHFKITPVILINKIQECRPHHQNSIIHKQLAFDIHLQGEKTYKIKNGISPTRPNSQIYKRLSKNFFENLKNGVDQCILFTGTESGARAQSSIGNQNNPGVFMIMAIAVLDQKYKENHERFDTEFSFLEYRGEKMYDLLNYTELPLEPKFRQNLVNGQKSPNVQFSEHRVKVCTFLQFIKLFKIALFNNKERDIRTNKQTSGKSQTSKKLPEFSSTFIMKFRVKKYNLENQLIQQQQTMMIDLDENCSLRSNGQNKQQNQRIEKQSIQNIRRTSDAGNRSLLDFILIDINNSNPSNKPIHYHMVEKNLLLEVLRKYLRQKQAFLPQNITKNLQKNIVPQSTIKQEQKQYLLGGNLFIINSFTTNPSNYLQNIKFYQSLTSALGIDWQANVRTKNVHNKLFDFLFSVKTLEEVTNSLKNRKYVSLKDLCVAKQFYIKQSKRIISDIKSNRNIILQYFNHKRNLTYSQNVLTAYQLQLIGNCVKSDNFKDFYSSKSYLALPRQINIKTQKIKGEIIEGLKNSKQVEDKFYLMKKKQSQDKKNLIVPEFLTNLSISSDKIKQTNLNVSKLLDKRQSKTKFKIIQKSENVEECEQNNDYESFIALKRYIYDYFSETWYRAFLKEQRTLTGQLIFQELFASEMGQLKERLKFFIKQVQGIQQINIKCMNDDKVVDLDNITQMMRSIYHSKKSLLKQDPRHSGKLTFSVSKGAIKSKKENIQCSTMNLPKIQQNQSLINKRQKSVSTKDKNMRKLQVFQINAKLNFGSLILNPKKLG